MCGDKKNKNNVMFFWNLISEISKENEKVRCYMSSMTQMLAPSQNYPEDILSAKVNNYNWHSSYMSEMLVPS